MKVAQWPNSNLQMQYKQLEQSTSNLNFVTGEFLKKLKGSADTFADLFLGNEKSIEELSEIERHDDAILMIYKDSIIQRFLNCYADTFKFSYPILQKDQIMLLI